MTAQWITMRGYIGGSENMMLQGFPSDWFLCFITVLRGLSTPMRVAVAFSITQGTLGNSEGRMAITQLSMN